MKDEMIFLLHRSSFIVHRSSFVIRHSPFAMPVRPPSKTRAQVIVYENGARRARPDHLATEEPLEIRLLAGGDRRTLAVTMRTPGSDFELAAGFLYGEG